MGDIRVKTYQEFFNMYKLFFFRAKEKRCISCSLLTNIFKLYPVSFELEQILNNHILDWKTNVFNKMILNRSCYLCSVQRYYLSTRINQHNGNRKRKREENKTIEEDLLLKLEEDIQKIRRKQKYNETISIKKNCLNDLNYRRQFLFIAQQ